MRRQHRRPIAPGEYWIHRTLKGGPKPPAPGGVWLIQHRQPDEALVIRAANKIIMRGEHVTVYHGDGLQPHGYILGRGTVVIADLLLDGPVATCTSVGVMTCPCGHLELDHVDGQGGGRVCKKCDCWFEGERRVI